MYKSRRSKLMFLCNILGPGTCTNIALSDLISKDNKLRKKRKKPNKWKPTFIHALLAAAGVQKMSQTENKEERTEIIQTEKANTEPTLLAFLYIC